MFDEAKVVTSKFLQLKEKLDNIKIIKDEIIIPTPATQPSSVISNEPPKEPIISNNGENTNNNIDNKTDCLYLIVNELSYSIIASSLMSCVSNSSFIEISNILTRLGISNISG